ncbi:MAG: methyltransferase domain-containing protein [Deltaproteobacteria bacterium]|nr:methyltransferase domain-containing protein [Deltaproteobacteria bacterium]
MRRRLLDLIVCPRCHCALDLRAYTSDGRGSAEEEVLDGLLRCGSCSGEFPVIGGVPRLLEPRLLRRMAPRYPEYFRAHPRLLGDDDGDEHVLADTLESFTRQRLDLPPPGPALVAQWHRNFRRYVDGTIGEGALRGKLVLDVGCGFGRHMYVAGLEGAEVVGVDLSGGVDRAYAVNRRRTRCHVVQANVLDRPFRDGVFDVVWSFGVLHHMPDPAAGFRAIVPFARPDGGTVVVWVYGYAGMTWSYRLSHMRALHRVTRRWSGPARARASTVVAAILSALYWEPLGAMRRAGLGGIVRRMPLTDYIDHPWRTRIAGVHDRLSTPITHFHDLRELSDWCRAAGLQYICVNDTERRGWHASGRRAGA